MKKIITIAALAAAALAPSTISIASASPDTFNPRNCYERSDYNYDITIYAANGRTSCPFARSTAKQVFRYITTSWDGEGDYFNVTAYSPVTRRYYRMSCASSYSFPYSASVSNFVCRGGNNARVWVNVLEF